MSKLKEKEIINYLEKVSKEKTIMPLDNYIHGLLDLYKAEKEENKKLKNCHLRYEEITGIDLLLED